MTDRTVHPRHQPALRAVVQRYERPLISFAQRWVLNTATARDIAQDTLLRLCQQSPEQLDELLRSGDRSRIEGWLFVVARNLAIDVQRRSGRTLPAGVVSPAMPAPEDPAQAAEQAELADRIIALIADLPDKQAQVVRLRFEQGLSYKAIATLTGHTTSYVGYLLHEGLKALRAKAGRQTQQKASA